MSVIRSFFWGMGAAALAYIVSPQVKKMARPMLKKSMDGASALAEKGKDAMDEMQDRKKCFKRTESKEGLSAFEHKPVSRDTTLEQISIERDLAVNEIRELRRVIDRMQDEINLLKEKV